MTNQMKSVEEIVESAEDLEDAIFQARLGMIPAPAPKARAKLGADLEVGDCLYQDGAILRIHDINETPLPGRRGIENLREVYFSDRTYKIIYRDVSYTLATV